MYYSWQDFVLAVSILGFNVALIPSIATKHKPHTITGLLTIACQLSALSVFISLSLWYSAAMSFVNTVLWAILVIQKLIQPRSAKHKKIVQEPNSLSFHGIVDTEDN